MTKLWRRVSLAALLACALSLHAAIPTNVRFTAQRTPSGMIDTRYLDGNDGTPAIPLLWQTVAAVSVSTGASGSINLRTLYLTEPGATPATLTTSCTPTLAGGFSAHADGITWSSTTAYSGLCRTTATRLGFVAISNEYRIEAIAPPSSDATAPTIPTGLTCTSGVGAFTCSWDASSDPYVGEAGSGVSAYDVRLDSTIVASPAASAGLSKQLTLTNLGSLTPTPSCTQSGADWTVVSAGTIDGTTDAAAFCNASIAGDAFATIKVQSITNTADYAKFGLERRDSTAANSRWIALYAQRLANGSVQVQCRRRPTDGASAGSLATVSGITLPVWLRLPAVGDLHTCEYSTDGNAFTAITVNHSLPMSATSLWGIIGTATTGGGGATATGDLRQFSVNNASRVTVTVNTLSSGTVTVRARDAATNASAYGAGVSVAPTAPADTTAPTFTVSPSGSAGGQTSINWSCGTATDANGIRGYIPATATASGGPFTDQAEQASNAYTQSGLASGTTYYLRCRAVDPSGNFSAPSVVVNAATSGIPPPDFTAPTVSSVTALSQTALRITHTAVNGADHYLLRTASAPEGPYAIRPEFDHTGLTVDRTGLTSGTRGCYQVAAANADESIIGPWSAVSEATTCGTTQTGGGAGIKFHPGHYLLLDGILRANNRTSLMATHQSHINEICADTNWRGIKIFTQWSSLEGPTAGDYAAGIAMIRQYLSWLRACNKHLMISVHAQQWGVGAPSGYGQYFPQYIVDGAAYGTTPLTTPSSITTRKWQPATADRLIALEQAYAAEFDSDPNMELVTSGETSQSITPGLDGFSNSALAAQIKRIVEASTVAWAHTAHRVSSNYLSPDSLFIDLLTHLVSHRVVIGGPDTLPLESVQANQLFKGLRRIQGTNPATNKPYPWGSAAAGTDLRGRVPFGSEVQSPELCGHEGCNTPSALFTYATTTDAVYPVYFVWLRNMSQPSSDPASASYQADWYNYRWTATGHPTAGIKAYVASIQGRVTSGTSSTTILPAAVPCPANYVAAGGCIQ